MKNFLAGLSAGLLLAAASPPVSGTGDTLRLVSLGDSIARGYGCLPEEAYGYRLYEDISAFLPAGSFSVEFQNCGTDGDTTADLLEKLRTDTALMEAVGRADILTVSIGGNDLIHQLDSVRSALHPAGGMSFTALLALLAGIQTAFSDSLAEETFQTSCANMDSVFDRLEELAPGAILLLTTIPNPSRDETVGPFVERYLRRYNEHIRNKCGRQEPRLFIADSSLVFESYTGTEPLTFANFDWTNPETLSFDPHPTPLGQALMAEAHMPLIEPMLSDWVRQRTATTTLPGTTAPVEDDSGDTSPFAVLLIVSGAALAAGIACWMLVKRNRR